MRGDDLIQTQLLMAQGLFAVAKVVADSNGTVNSPSLLADLPLPADTPAGMVACITDSNVNTWGSVISGGGTLTVLGFYNGTNWTVIGK